MTADRTAVDGVPLAGVEAPAGPRGAALDVGGGVESLSDGRTTLAGASTTTRPITPAQHRIWFRDTRAPGGPGYIIPRAYRLRGSLDGDALVRALDVLIERHEALRTTFALFEGSPVQRVAARGMAFWRRFDLEALPPEDRESAVFRHLRRESRRPFDLARGPVLRALLLRLGHDHHVLSISAPLLALDRWSMGLVCGELGAAYEAEVAGGSGEVQRVGVGAWSYDWTAPPVAPPTDRHVLGLPYDRAPDGAPRRAGARIAFGVDESLTEALREIARAERATLFTVLLAAFAALLRRYTDQDTLLIGTPVAHRLTSDLEGIVGCLGDDVSFQINTGGNPTFRELVRRARAAVLKANEPRESNASLVAAPPVQVGVALERPEAAPLFGDLDVEVLPVEDGTSTCEVGLSLRARGLGLAGVATYRGDLFARGTIQRLLDHFGRLMAAAAADPDRSLGAMSMLSAAERRRVVTLGRGPVVEAGTEETVWSLIASQAAQMPAATALEADGDTLTFCELRTEAMTVAAALGRLGVGPAQHVGVLVDGPVQRVAACLGVLAAGAAFVTLEADAHWIAYVTEDAGLTVILTDRREGSWSDSARAAGAHVMRVSHRPVSEARAERARGASPALASPVEPAYIIYGGVRDGRSGGVIVEHRSVLGRLAWYRQQFPLRPGETVLVRRRPNQSSSWGVLHALAAGGRCVFEPRDSDASLASHVATSQAAYVRVSATGLERFIGEARARDLGACRSLRAVICESDGLQPALIDSFYDRVRGAGLPDVRLHSLYGRPGTTGDALHWMCPPSGAASRGVVLGRPIAGARAYVVDDWGRLCPVGVPGEIWIGGTPVARGFLGRAELTSERFLPDPFAAGGRVFRTGEKARWRSDGQLEAVAQY